MAKRVTHNIKLNIPAGKGTPAPPVGPALGQAGVNMMEFLKKFNEITAPQMGSIMPVKITVFEDRSYVMQINQPLIGDMIKKELGLQKGNGATGKTPSIAKLTKAQVRKIAEQKLPDLNTDDLDAAMKIVAGSARSMGIDSEV
ncbi:MAG: 50S ribosomal protein L11 [Fimbriimonadaceae bacterium]|nr:50S ribosomal protein L11 [Fimbriimonadaceae bacterium]